MRITLSNMISYATIYFIISTNWQVKMLKAWIGHIFIRTDIFEVCVYYCIWGLFKQETLVFCLDYLIKPHLNLWIYINLNLNYCVIILFAKCKKTYWGRRSYENFLSLKVLDYVGYVEKSCKVLARVEDELRKYNIKIPQMGRERSWIGILPWSDAVKNTVPARVVCICVELT